MEFYEINIFQVMTFRIYTLYNKRQMIKKLQSNKRKNRKCYRKCSNNFAVD